MPYTVAVSRDGSRYLWGGGSPDRPCPLFVFDTKTNKQLFELIDLDCPALNASFLPDGGVVAAGWNSQLCVWSAQGELLANNGVDREGRFEAFALSGDAQYALIGGSQGEIAGWRLSEMEQVLSFKDNSKGHEIQSMAMHPSALVLVSGRRDGVIRVWDLQAKKRLRHIELGVGNHIKGLAWHPDGKRFLAAVAPDGAADGDSSRGVLFDAATGQQLNVFDTQKCQPFCCAISPDGAQIAIAGGGTDNEGSEKKKNCVIHFWETGSGHRLEQLKGHSAHVRRIAFSPDSRWLLSTAWDETVRCWAL